MAEKKMIWKQQPGIDYTRKADALIGAVCRYLNTSDMYIDRNLYAVASILGIEQVEVPEEKTPAFRGTLDDKEMASNTMDLGSGENCIQE
jgi:hypothetical protein